MSGDSPHAGTDGPGETPKHYNHDIERVIVGACLTNPHIVGDLDPHITPNLWHNPHHATIWTAIHQHWMDGHAGGPIAIATTLANRGDLNRIGGAGYLHTCITAGETAAGDITWYIRKLADLATLRALHEATTRAHQTTSQPNGHTPTELADRITTIITAATDLDAVRDNTMATVEQLVEPALAAIDAAASGANPAKPTGFADLDRMLGGGLRDGQLILVAGRPAMGKTVLATNIMTNMAKTGHRGLYLTLEMSNQELMMRLLADQCRIPLADITTGQLDDEQWSTLAQRSADLAELPIHVDDNAHITLPYVRNAARRLNARHPLDVIVIDYLQLITSVTNGRPPENRQVEVSALSRGCKLLAKELHVPLIVVAQLNRNPAGRTDKTPQLTDLRESGSLEQDADIVLFVHRDDYYDTDSPRRGEADLILAKHRGGQTGTVVVASQLHYSKFVDMAIG